VKPLISVCILAYNRAGRVLSLLDSNVAQESPHIERSFAKTSLPNVRKFARPALAIRPCIRGCFDV